MAAEASSKVEIGIPGVDFAQMAREAIAGQLMQAMVATPEMVQKLVVAALTQRVDSEGHARNGYSQDKPFIEWACEGMIRKATLDMFKAELERLRPEIEKGVARCVKESAGAIAKALTESYISGSGHQFNTAIELKVTRR